MTDPLSILIADDDRPTLNFVAFQMRRKYPNSRIIKCRTIREVLQYSKNRHIDMAILDLRYPDSGVCSHNYQIFEENLTDINHIVYMSGSNCDIDYNFIPKDKNFAHNIMTLRYIQHWKQELY
jgi:DNA-binding NtrC family response regulator